uniref:Uncharacterized protein n=1 Tax=Rhizophora mucronata TaxID=61149 RepID=A0A2P2R4Y0_RHIMU
MKDVVAMLKEIRHIEALRPEADISKEGLIAIRSPSPPNRIVVSQGSSHCSFAFSDDSI